MKLKKKQPIQVKVDGEWKEAVYEGKSANKEMCLVTLIPTSTICGEPIMDLVRLEDVRAR